MSDSLDLYAIFLAVIVTALFVAWFWHVFREMRLYPAGIWRFLDGRATRQRTQLLAEAQSGSPSTLRRAAQSLTLTVLAALLALLFIRKFELM